MFELREQVEDMDTENIESLNTMMKTITRDISEQGINLQKYLDNKVLEKAVEAAVKLKYLSKVRTYFMSCTYLSK